MERPRVLVVEDRPSVLNVIAEILQTGYEVTTASDGETAISRIRSGPFEVVLTDVRMPGASGFEVLKAVNGRSATTRVILMTAYANVPDAVAAIKAGAYDYVAKPVDADDVSLAVARAVDDLRRAKEPARAASPTVDRKLLPTAALQHVSVGFHHAVEEARDLASRAYLSDLMRAFNGNVTQAARCAAMTRESLHRVLKKYGVHSQQHRDGGDAGAGEGPSGRVG
jgi:DNA-binding NtrC family response regulator